MESRQIVGPPRFLILARSTPVPLQIFCLINYCKTFNNTCDRFGLLFRLGFRVGITNHNLVNSWPFFFIQSLSSIEGTQERVTP